MVSNSKITDSMSNSPCNICMTQGHPFFLSLVLQTVLVELLKVLNTFFFFPQEKSEFANVWKNQSTFFNTLSVNYILPDPK